MLKRHLCSIDLNKNRLVIGSTGTETRFLNENEVPKKFTQNEAHVSASDDNALAQAVDQSLKEASAAGSSSSATASSSPFADPAAVSSLEAMGFKRQDVIEELIRCKGDKNQAVAALLAKSIQVPK